MQAVNLNEVTPEFGKEYWRFDGQIKVERCTVNGEASISGPETLRAFVADSVELLTAATAGSNVCYMSDDGTKLYRVVSSSFLEGCVLKFTDAELEASCQIRNEIAAERQAGC